MRSITISNRIRYYKRSRPGEEPAKFKVKHEGKNIHATTLLDPVLKKHPDLKKAILQHERSELKAIGKGNRSPHSQARHREPRLTRDISGVSGFWKEVKRRERMR